MNIDFFLSHPRPVRGAPLTLHALARITGRLPDEGDRRAPLNLALVLDRSGSMAGEKLDHAKEAAALLLRRLWPEDRISVVAYDDEVTTLASGATGDARGEAERRVRELVAGSVTNLSGGWVRGRDLVGSAPAQEGMNRILLLTDGMANQGITDPGALTGLCAEARKAGISTTTIGFGEGFDELLLRAMADAGGGATYYIENPDQAPGIFEEEVEGLLSLAAHDLTVEIVPEGDTLLTAVRHSYPTTKTERGLVLDVGDLYARERALRLQERGDVDGAEWTHRDAAGRVEAEAHDDPEADEEVRGLRRIADLVRENRFAVRERKYLRQEAYDLPRSREVARRRYRRP